MIGDQAEGTAQAGREQFAEQLRRIAAARNREQRSKAMDELAVLVHKTAGSLQFVGRLTQGDRNSQRLALEMALRLPLPLPRELFSPLVPLLGDARFSVPLRLNVSVQYLRSFPPSAEEATAILQSITNGLSPRRAIERLKYIEARVPSHARLRAFTTEVEQQATIACPRCDARLSRPDLIVHLWQDHQLMLDGSRAREPWRMIEDWVTEYGRTGKAELLELSSELGQQLDPQNGLTRVHRLLLAAGLTDDEAQQHLRSQAEGRRATLCPHCYALVHERPEWTAPAMNLSPGRMTGQGYEVELIENGVFTRLWIDSPEGVLHDGPEPGRLLSRHGRVIFCIGPIVLFALGLAILLPLRWMPPLTPVSFVLLAAFLLYLRLRIGQDPRSELTKRAVDHTWRFVVPLLHRADFSRTDAEFLASLARTSMGIGSTALREPLIRKAAKTTQTQIRSQTVSPEYLTALRSLEIDDAQRDGQDSMMILAEQLGACLAGELPLVYGEQLLDAWPNDSRDQAQRARLRILVCAQAFELGFEARDLLELGRICPLIGQAYASEDRDGLANLRWLWEIKPTRSWQKFGSATTAFDLARYPALGEQYLASRPDLLLFQPTSDIGSDADPSTPILICEEGVLYRDILIRDPETTIAVKERPLLAGGGYELAIGKQRIIFEADPTMTSKRLQGWVKFLFREFLPRSVEVRSRRSPGRLKKLLWQKTILCPDCERPFLALRGEVGIVTDAQVGSRS